MQPISVTNRLANGQHHRDAHASKDRKVSRDVMVCGQTVSWMTKQSFQKLLGPREPLCFAAVSFFVLFSARSPRSLG